METSGSSPQLEPSDEVLDARAYLRSCAQRVAAQHGAEFEFHSFMAVLRFKALTITITAARELGTCYLSGISSSGYASFHVDRSVSSAVQLVYEKSTTSDTRFDHLLLTTQRSSAWDDFNVVRAMIEHACARAVSCAGIALEHDERQAKRRQLVDVSDIQIKKKEAGPDEHDEPAEPDGV